MSSSGCSRAFVAVVLCAACLGCPRKADEGHGPVAAFGDPTAAPPLAFEQYPWPNDLMLKDGHIGVTFKDFGEDRDPGVPAANEFMASVLHERSGFSGTASVIFHFDALLDPSSLPQTPDEAARSQAVFIMGVTGPHAGMRLRARVKFNALTQQLFVTPHYGERMLNGERYAAIITTEVTGTDGGAVRGSTGFRQLWPLPKRKGVMPWSKAADAQPPSGLFKDLPPLLGMLGVSSDDVVAATVFTVERPEVELLKIRDAVLAEPLAPLVRTELFPRAGYDLDRLMGVPTFSGVGIENGAVPHAHISHVLHGTFHTPLFIAAEPGQNGILTFNADGTPRVTGHEDVPFTLALPSTVSDVTQVPLLIYQHGLGGQRSEVMVVAEEFCRRGFAVVGMDLPFHGSRTPPLPGVDRANNITGEHVADGIGDAAGLQPAFLDFGITSSNPTVLPLTPSIVRDSFRQGHADLFGFVRNMLDGDKAPLVNGITEFAGLNFDRNRVYFMAESFGSIHGVPVVAVEPAFKGAVFSVGGGGLVVDTLLNSPEYAPPLAIFLYQKLGLFPLLTDTLAVDYAHHPPETTAILQVYQNALEPADPIAFAPMLARTPLGQPRNVLFFAPFSDEAVPNQAEEALAHAAGATAVRMSNGPTLRFGDMPVQDAPVTDNVNGVTVAFMQFTPAAHGMLTRRKDHSLKEPDFPPFVDRATPLEFDNPADLALRTAAAFLDGLAQGNHAAQLAP